MKRILKPIKTAILMVGIGYTGVKLYEISERLCRNAKAKMQMVSDMWNLEFDDKESVREFINKLNRVITEYGVFYVDREGCFGWDEYAAHDIKVFSNGRKWIVRISKPKYHN